MVDARTTLAIADVQVKVKVTDPTTVETKTLDIISANNRVSYGHSSPIWGIVTLQAPG